MGPAAIEWLSDNGSVYIAHDTVDQAEALGLVVCTTPPYSPESNGMAEFFVKGFKRDYVYLADVRTADELYQLQSWFHDHNHVRPHKGLKLLSPMEYRGSTWRAEVSGFRGATPPLPRTPQ